MYAKPYKFTKEEHMDTYIKKDDTETIIDTTVGGVPFRKEIKRCPFCGGSARIKMLTSGPEDKGRVAYVCTMCGASGPVMRVDEYDDSDTKFTIHISRDAERAWNTRAF